MGSTEQISEPFPACVWGWKRAPAFQVSKSSFLPQCHWRIWKEGNCAHCRSDQSTRPGSSISGAFSATIIVPGTLFLHSSPRTPLSSRPSQIHSLALLHLLSNILSTPWSLSLNPKAQILSFSSCSGSLLKRKWYEYLQRNPCARPLIWRLKGDCGYAMTNEILKDIMRYGVGPIPLRTGLWDKRGLKLRVPRRIKKTKKQKWNKTLGLLFLKAFSWGWG